MTNSDLLSSVNDLARHLTTLSVTLLAVVAYLCFVAVGVSHEMLLRDGSLSMPLVDVNLPVYTFFLAAPVFLLLLHFNLLILVETLRLRVALLLEEGAESASRLAPVAMGSAPDAEQVEKLLTTPAQFAIVAGYISPLLALLLIEKCFLPYQGKITLLHVACVFVDGGLLLSYLVFRPPARQESAPRDQRSRDVATWVAAVAMVAALAMLAVPGWNRITVRERLLVAEEPQSALVAVLSAEGMSRDEILARFSRGLDLGGRSLRHADLTGSKLYRASLSGADLSGALLFGADLSGADLGPSGDAMWSGHYVARTVRPERYDELQQSDYEPTKLTAADLRHARLLDADLTGAVLDGAKLQEAVLVGAEMVGASLTGAELERADLRLVNLARARLDGAQLLDSDLSGANLFRASMVGADLSAALAYGVDFERAVAHLARFEGARLIASNFTRAELVGANFEDSHLHGSQGLHPQWASLRSAQVEGACLCPICLPSGDDVGEAGRQAQDEGGQARVGADMRGLRWDTPPVQLVPSPFPSIESMPIEDVADRLAALATRRSQLLGGFARCYPEVAPGRGLSDDDGEASVEVFYRKVGRRLLNLACSEGGRPVGRAMVEATDIGPFVASSDTVKGALARSLSEAVDEVVARGCI